MLIVCLAQRRLLKSNDLISKNPISLRISSPQVPDLTLVDLPGFITSPQQAINPNPDVDISKQVKYISMRKLYELK